MQVQAGNVAVQLKHALHCRDDEPVRVALKCRDDEPGVSLA